MTLVIRILASLALATLACRSTPAPSSPSSADDVVIGEPADGKTVAVARGKVLVVRLPAIPGTGYTWTPSVDAPGVLEQLGPSTYERVAEGDAEGRVGQPELQVFWFRANAPGAARLELAYARVWEEGVEPLRRFRVTVTVR